MILTVSCCTTLSSLQVQIHHFRSCQCIARFLQARNFVRTQPVRINQEKQTNAEIIKKKYTISEISKLFIHVRFENILIFRTI